MADVIGLEYRRTLLKKQACFVQLTENEYEVLTDLLAEKAFKKGDTIVTEGDPVDSVYIIVSGRADVRHAAIKHGLPEITSVAKLGPEQAIGLNEFGFYSLSGVRTATVVAETDMITLRLSVAAFHGFALAYPHVNEVMRKYAETFLGIVKLI